MTTFFSFTGTRGFVYFVGAGKDHLIKIGWTIDPDRRVKDLAPQSLRPLTLLAVAPGMIFAERAVQNAFIKSHVRHEWFRPSEKLWELIAQVESTGELPRRYRGNCKTPDKVKRLRHAAIRKRKRNAAFSVRVEDVSRTSRDNQTFVQ